MKTFTIREAMSRSLLLLLGAAVSVGAQTGDFRPPAVPLITHDPYFSVWSFSDELHASDAVHWTGGPNTLGSMIRIDGKAFRLMGNDPRFRLDKPTTEPLPQTGLEVHPTRTVYRFEGEGVRVDLEFLTPALPHDVDALARPATYLTWTVSTTDGRSHDVQVYFDATADLVRESSAVPSAYGRYRAGDLDVLRVGSQEQPVLEKRGDRIRIDWGYLYAVAPPAAEAQTSVGDRLDSWYAFHGSGDLPKSDELEPDWLPGRKFLPALAHAFDLGSVGASPVSRYLVVAYDDVFSFEFLFRRLRPYWRSNRTGPEQMLREALNRYGDYRRRCVLYDRELAADLERAGGRKYAQMAILAFRQALAAHKIVVDIDGRPLMFSKENHSNGSAGTVDVMYPASPIFLLLNPDLMKANMDPIFQYASLDRWPFPYAPHDVGQYPLGNGQAYGGGETSEERQMPVEESANMILMAAGVVKGEDDPAYARANWKLLTQWAEYLEEKGFDPESQLSTDDFTGHLAHNTNLSLKAIVALAAYAQMAERLNESDDARKYRGIAERFAGRWVRDADDGDHFRLTFDQPGTWSQKYNLVWDRVLGLDLFPPEVADKEVSYYLKIQNEYGLPLDNRSQFTKLDWIYWSATLARDEEDFRALVAPTWKFAHETPDRVPLTDWYWTHDGRRRGFQARSVVGGLFIKMLADEAMWRKWVAKSR